MPRMRKKKMGAVTEDRTLEVWIDLLDKTYGEGWLEIDDLDKVELLDLLKELERRRADDGKENCKNFK